MSQENRNVYTAIILVKSDLNKQEVNTMATEMLKSIREIGGRPEPQAGFSEEGERSFFSVSQKEMSHEKRKQKSANYMCIIFSASEREVRKIVPAIQIDLQDTRNVLMVMNLKGASKEEIATLNSCKANTRVNYNNW